MRPHITAFVTALCLATSALDVSAQTLVAAPAPAPPPPPKPRLNGIQADLSLGVIGLAYERVVHENVTLHGAIQYFRPWYTGQPVFGLSGELRVVFSLFHGPAPRGLYLSPFGRVAYVTAHSNGVWGDGPSWSAGATFGYSILAGGWFNARFGAGVQYFAYDFQAGTERFAFASFYPAVDIMLSVFF